MAFENASTVFHVRDLNASLKFYTEILGFEQVFVFGSYGGVKSGNVSIHLSSPDGDVLHRPLGGGTIYIYCDNVDDYYATIVKKGAKVKGEPRDWSYGMRDFQVVDPDGNHLAFGCDREKPEEDRSSA